MRTSPLIGRKAWFGPKRFGWGLGPVSVEGWAVTAAALALAAVDRRRERAGQVRSGPLLTALFLLTAVLKGTAPGGRRARRAFKAAKRAGE